MAWLKTAGLIALAMLALMSVAFVDGRPSAFSDTALYYSQGEAIAQRLGLGHPAGVDLTDPTSIVTNDRRPPPTELDAYVGARSPIYGAALYAAVAAGSLWLVAALQALAAAVVLYIATKAIAPRRPTGAYIVAIGALTAASSLPFLAAFAMPDVFCGLAALSAIALLAALDRLSRAASIILWLVLAFSLACHDAYPPTIIGVLLAAALALAAFGLPVRVIAVRTGLVAAAVATALLAGGAVQLAHRAASGHDQRQPPFLAARVLADGPGRLYLREACADGATFALCAFKDRPLTNSDGILWADDPARGVFSVADAATRLAIEREQMRFVTNAVTTYPLAELGAASLNAVRQLGLVYVDDPLRDPAAFWLSPYFSRTRLTRIVPGIAACRSLGPCAPPFPLLLLRIVDQTAIVAAIALILWRLTRRDIQQDWKDRALSAEDKTLVLTVVLVLAAIVANDALSGALSGPFPRYGARITWLIVWAAIMVVARLGLTGAARPASSPGAGPRDD